MGIDVSNLEPGDVVIQYLGYNHMPADDIKGSHAMVFVGNELEGLPTVVHQIGQSAVNAYGMHQDVLLPNSPASTDQGYTQRKRILRCKRPALAAMAAQWARVWSDRFQIDFSSERGTQSQTFEDRLRQDWQTPSEVVRVHRRLFESVGKWRAIKYAARRNGYLCYPGEDDYKGKGMHCSMFVAVCYQVAGLADVVEAAPDDPQVRVSDKRMWEGGEKALQPFNMNATDVQMYGAYVRTLHEHDFYDLKKPPATPKAAPKGVTYLPAASRWRGPSPASYTDFAQLVTAGMLVDAKVVKATSLYQSLCRDTEDWEDLGDLTGDKRPESDLPFKRHLLRNEQAVQQRKQWLNR